MVWPDNVDQASRETPTLGARFIATVILAAVIPLGALGLWTTQSAARSGADLLRTQLDSQLSELSRDVLRRWDNRRADILLLTENEAVRLELSNARDVDSLSSAPPFVKHAFSQMTGLNHVVLRDRSGHVRWTLDAPGFASLQRQSAARNDDVRGIPVHLPVTDLISRDTIGSVDAVIQAVMLLPVPAGPPPVNGPLTGVFLPDGRSIVSPLIDERLFSDDQVQWSGTRWLTVRRQLTEPAIEIAVAGALDPYAGVFKQTARRAAAMFVAAALAIAILLVTITRRTTRAVERKFAQREALAAVGEFASELAHEVRNPLSAIRLDLQRLEEVAESPAAVRANASRVLRQIDRLNRAVTGALRVSRGDSGHGRRVPLSDIIEHARRAAEPEFTDRGASLVVQAMPPIELEADAEALEQVFLNLLINAAHALNAGGSATVSAVEHADTVEITVSDKGIGMTSEQIEDAKRPYRSTKSNGTGLGLKIARRIVTNHHGEIDLESAAGLGTTVRVTLRR
jgi:signal transduction histidine kinase